MAASFDRSPRARDDLAAYFAHFGESECPPLGGHVYRELCREIKNDPVLLSLAAKASATQPVAKFLFTAVRYRPNYGLLTNWAPIGEAEICESCSSFPPSGFAAGG